MPHLKSFFLLYRSMILQWVKSTEALKRCHWQHRQQQQQQLRRYRHKSQPHQQQQQQQQDEIPIGLWPPRVTGAWNLIWRQVGGEVNSQLYRRLKTFISLLQMSWLYSCLSYCTRKPSLSPFMVYLDLLYLSASLSFSNFDWFSLVCFTFLKFNGFFLLPSFLYNLSLRSQNLFSSITLKVRFFIDCFCLVRKHSCYLNCLFQFSSKGTQFSPYVSQLLILFLSFVFHWMNVSFFLSISSVCHDRTCVRVSDRIFELINTCHVTYCSRQYLERKFGTNHKWQIYIFSF